MLWLLCCSYSLSNNEACRSLRSCLRHHAKKENGKFVRKEVNGAILYAVRKASAAATNQSLPAARFECSHVQHST